jgi:anti-anti-sigma factor
MSSPFTVEVRRSRQMVQLLLTGELDQDSLTELEATFEDLGGQHGKWNVVVDVRALEFCDSAGWRSLETCRREGATLVGNPACLRRLFYLIRHAHKLPPELHELRGLHSGPMPSIPGQMRKSA